MRQLASALVVATMLLAHSTGGAQESGGGYGGCALVTICGGGHTVTGTAEIGVRNPHSDCLVCIDQGGCHPECDVTLVPSVRPIYALVLAAARKGDAATIMQLAPQLPGFVSYNVERKSIQVASCNRRSIIANLPLRSPRELAGAARLPGADLVPAVALALSR